MSEEAVPSAPTPRSPAAAAMNDLVQWSSGLPRWQRDALRRLSQQEGLTERDLAELTELCLRRHQASGDGSETRAHPLTATHVRADTKGRAVALRSIRDVARVNALADGQVLKFRQTGLTVVFGGNGSGKSGYARVLKKACRARGTDAPILPNVYVAGARAPATAAVEYSIGRTHSTAAWTDGSPTDHALSAISVFDSASARIHVDETNDVAYTPSAMALLARLADTCRQIKARLASEQQSLEAAVPAALATPKCHAQTEVGKLVASLSESTDLAAVRKLAVLADDDNKRLETLRVDLASDPRKVAEQLGLRKKRLLQTLATVEALDRAVGAPAEGELKRLLADYLAKTEAARVAAEDLFTGEPLPKVGSGIWRALWDAAREYSSTEAYPGQAFPVTGDTARCVLCQQELEADSARRLDRFETFVKENTQKAAHDARQTLNLARNAILATNVAHQAQVAEVGQVRDELDSPALANDLRRFLAAARWRRRGFLRASTPESWATLPGLPSAPIDAIRALDGELNKRILELRSAADADARRLLEQEFQELEDRVWLSSVLDDIAPDIARRKKLAVTARAIDGADTRGITNKSTGLAEKLVTTALRDRFAEEVGRLGMTRLRVELVQATSQYGVPRFRVSLVGSRSAQPGLVLSEGEHRCIALAAFLSELATADDPSGIVLDDPVSSLDHDYRRAVAERLVVEASRRQVIVFTHDVVFLTQLAQHTRRLGVPAAYQSLARNSDRSGVRDSEPPIGVRPVLDESAGLTKRLKQVSQAHAGGHEARWQMQAEAIAVQLRKLWERAVEEVLSPVYARYDHNVDTKNLIAVTVLTEADCRAMRAGYSTCSAFAHTEGAAAATSPPTPADIQKEIDALRGWITSVLARQKAVARQKAAK